MAVKSPKTKKKPLTILRGFFLVGAGSSAEPALLKTSRRRVFAPPSAAGPQLFESARSRLQKATENKKRMPLCEASVFGGRGWIRTVRQPFCFKIPIFV
jgi:hypothetical protein